MYLRDFDATKVKDACVQWICDWFEKNGKGCNAIIGISGGKDSTVAAALCVEALGKDRVQGVLMPNGIQSDLNIALEICDVLDIPRQIINIEDAVRAIRNAVSANIETFSAQSDINLPARVRMTTLYAVSQSMNGRVVNTCNKSEDWVGYATKYGDAAGDFSPLSNLLVSEVKAIGYALGLPKHFIEKVPTDGLCGKTDEENLGFSYNTLDAYIGRGIKPEPAIKEKIDKLHKQNLFKLLPMKAFIPKV